MKKTRFIPYGYSIRNGLTVIEHDEAEVIRHIFNEYIKGASLKELADELTRRRIPYSEKTEIWDKARIARIIENAKYTGDDEYDPIIDEDMYEEAVAAKSARQRNTILAECEGINTIRNRVRCGKCGAPMVRRTCSKRKIKESWTCDNPECGYRVRISDTDLLAKATILINRIIENSELMIPKNRYKPKDSPIVMNLQNEINNELASNSPSEQLIIDRIGDIASQLYKETQAKRQITARIACQREAMMKPQEHFNSDYFSDIIENIVLDDFGRVRLVTKTETEITEGENENANQENREKTVNTDRPQANR